MFNHCLKLSLGLHTLALLASILVVNSNSANAQEDFFDREEEEVAVGDQNAVPDFSILSAFGGEQTPHWADGPQKPKVEHWSDFEDVSGTEVERRFLNSGEIKMQQELKKPLPERRPFGDQLDTIERSINSLKAPNLGR